MNSQHLILLIHEFSTFSTVGLVDANGDETVVTVFNLTIHRGFLVGDSLTIPDPCYTVVDVKHLDKVSASYFISVNQVSIKYYTRTTAFII